MLPSYLVNKEVSDLNRTWLSLVQKSVRRDEARASDFGLTAALAIKVEALSCSDLDLVASTWRTPLFVPRSLLSVENALDRAVDSGVRELAQGLTQEQVFFSAYLQAAASLCRIDHSCAGERFWLPQTLTRKLRFATAADISHVAADLASSRLVARCASLIERMVNHVTSTPVSSPVIPQRLVVMGLASLLAEDINKVT